MRKAVLLAFFAALLGWAAPATAAVTLAFGPEVYTPGASSGYVDLTVSGDAFQNYSLQLQITVDASNTPAYELQFGSIANISSDTYGNGYVFGSDSLDVPGPLGATAADSHGYQTTLTIGDFTTSGNNTQAGSLLARLDFNLQPNAAQGKFDISVVQNQTYTYFQTSGGTNLGINGTLSDTLMVGAPAVATVPEPGTFGMLLAGVCGLIGTRLRRKRALT